jgi:hypothetical protein
MTITKAYALGALAFVAIAAYCYSPTSFQEPTAAAKPLSPEQQCDAALLMEHATVQMNELRTKPVDQWVAEVTDFSPWKLIAQRRENERFCLRIAACYNDPKIAGIRFSTCLDGEEQEVETGNQAQD